MLLVSQRISGTIITINFYIIISQVTAPALGGILALIQVDGDTLTVTENGYTLNHAGTVTVVFYADRTTAGGTTYRIYSAPVTVTFEHFYDNDCDTDCNGCGEGREVAGHDYKSTVTAPTCTDKGYTTYTCVNCGHFYTADETEATGHKYDDDKDADCNVCGDVREIIATEGNLNKYISWSYADGVLTITGKGKIKNFSAGTTPWAGFANEVTAIVIGDGITYIGSSAFYGFANVTDVTIAETVTAIGNYAFYKCTALKSIKIPAAVTEIGIYAFRSTGLTSAEFGITYGWTAGETAYTSNEVKTSAAAILKKAGKVTWTRDINAEEEAVDPNFVDGGILKNGTTKWAVTKLENGKLKLTISGNGNMPEFSTGEAPWYKADYALDIVEIEIAEGVTNVGRCAFYGLKYVSKVTLPSTVTAINDYGFYMCFLLKNIELPEGTTVGRDAFVKTKVAL